MLGLAASRGCDAGSREKVRVFSLRNQVLQPRQARGDLPEMQSQSEGRKVGGVSGTGAATSPALDLDGADPGGKHGVRGRRGRRTGSSGRRGRRVRRRRRSRRERERERERERGRGGVLATLFRSAASFSGWVPTSAIAVPASRLPRTRSSISHPESGFLRFTSPSRSATPISLSSGT